MMFTIGDRVFPTTAKAREAVRAVLHGVEIETPLTGEDFTLIRALLDMHRNYEKLAHGCAAIVVRLNRVQRPTREAGSWKARGFWVIGDDGVETSFSYMDPFKTDAQSVKADQSWAARYAVEPSIEWCRDDHYRCAELAPCQISGIMTKYEDARVHHDEPWPFDRIHREWISQRGGYPELVKPGRSWMMKPDDAADFKAFHDARAILKVVDKNVHFNLKKNKSLQPDVELK